MKRRRIWASAAAFAAGSGLYALCEVAYRGWTHWTMALAGGVSLTLIYLCCGGSQPRWQKWLMSTALITTVEFVFGCVLNLRLGLRIWDYRSRALHLYGQICPLFCGVWFLLSIPAVQLCARLRRWASRPR